jgi:hypothetical protein
LIYWKRQELELPRLSAIARDILPIAAAGVGIERVFNISRDVCDYRRANMSPETIRALMIKYHYDYKESTHLKDARLKEIADEVPLTAKELEEELEERTKAVERAMKRQYISDNEIEDFEEDTPRKQPYRKRPRMIFQQRLGQRTPEAQLPRQTSYGSSIYDYPSSDDEIFERRIRHEVETGVEDKDRQNIEQRTKKNIVQMMRILTSHQHG